MKKAFENIVVREIRSIHHFSPFPKTFFTLPIPQHLLLPFLTQVKFFLCTYILASTIALNFDKSKFFVKNRKANVEIIWLTGNCHWMWLDTPSSTLTEKVNLTESFLSSRGNNPWCIGSRWMKTVSYTTVSYTTF